MKTQRIEQTGKSWKAIKAMGCLAMFVGLLIFVAGATMEESGVRRPDAQWVGAGSAVMFAGASAWLFGRLGSWWFHG